MFAIVSPITRQVQGLVEVQMLGFECVALSDAELIEYKSKENTHFGLMTDAGLQMLVKPTLPDWSKVRDKRDELLKEADIEELRQLRLDTRGGAFPSQSFLDIGLYKDALCDVTTDFASPNAVVWPAKPWA